MSNVTKLNEYSDDVSNAELVKKSQLGDKNAFEELVRRHQELVFSLAYKLTGNRELANDVAQEAFIRAWKAIQKFRKKSEILIYTDSTYVRDGITTWIKKWEKNGWKTASKKPVKNRELWKKLKDLSSKHSIKWIWVKGHAHNKYNNIVDELAQGAIRR